MTDRTFFGLNFPELVTRVLWGASAILFVLMAFAAFGGTNGAWPLCVAGVACMVFANLDRISAISASTSGINIALGRAEVSIAQMTRLLRTSATAQLAIVQRAGRWDGFNVEEKQAFLDESISLLREAGISEGEIRDVRYKYWDRFELFDYVHAILGGKFPRRMIQMFTQNGRSSGNSILRQRPARYAISSGNMERWTMIESN